MFFVREPCLCLSGLPDWQQRGGIPTVVTGSQLITEIWIFSDMKEAVRIIPLPQTAWVSDQMDSTQRGSNLVILYSVSVLFTGVQFL